MRILVDLCVGAALCALCACSLAQAPSQQQQLARMLDKVADADVDKDGRITRQEWIAFRSARFERADRNHDGQLSAADVPSMLRGRSKAGQLDQVIAAIDQDGDGKLNREEFVSATRLFDWLDKDRNGVIDAAELKRTQELVK